MLFVVPGEDPVNAQSYINNVNVKSASIYLGMKHFFFLSL